MSSSRRTKEKANFAIIRGVVADTCPTHWASEVLRLSTVASRRPDLVPDDDPSSVDIDRLRQAHQESAQLQKLVADTAALDAELGSSVLIMITLAILMEVIAMRLAGEPIPGPEQSRSTCPVCNDTSGEVEVPQHMN